VLPSLLILDLIAHDMALCGNGCWRWHSEHGQPKAANHAQDDCLGIFLDKVLGQLLRV
jgi:hypothetical protein